MPAPISSNDYSHLLVVTHCQVIVEGSRRRADDSIPQLQLWMEHAEYCECKNYFVPLPQLSYPRFLHAVLRKPCPVVHLASSAFDEGVF